MALARCDHMQFERRRSIEEHCVIFLDHHRFRWVVALSIMAMVLAGSWMPAAAVEVSTPEAEAADSSVMSTEAERNTTLEITLRDSSGRDFPFPAGQEICLGVTVTPDAGGAPIVLGPCFDESSSVPALWAGMPHPDSATYAVTVASNSTTCTDITIPPINYADYGGGGWFAIFHVTMTCPDAPPPPEEPPADALYDGLRINYVNDGAPADLPGMLCFRITADPVVPRSPFDTCTRTATFSYNWIGTVTTPLPVGVTYTAAELRNESGCVGTPQPLRAVTQDDGKLIAEIDVRVRCGPATPPAEAVLDTLTLRVDDRSGAPITTYPGEVCIAVTADPAIAVLDLRGPVCGSVTPRTATWSSSDAVSFPVTTTYSASTVSNATGCEVEIDPAVVERSEDDTYRGVIQAWIACEEEPVPSPTPTPGATATATATAPMTATSTETATATTSATSSPTPTATGTATHDDPTRTATSPHDDPSSGTLAGSGPVDHDPDASSTAEPLVTMLPSTGVGPRLPASLGLLFAAMILALACGVSMIAIERRR